MRTVKEFEFFTSNPTERYTNKDENILYLFIKPNGLKIRCLTVNGFLTNITPIELTVNLETFQITNNHKFILFSDLMVKEIIKFESTLDLNDLKNFTEYLKVEATRSDKFRQSFIPTNVSEKELNLIVSEIVGTLKDKLIDKALLEKDEETFKKLTGAH